MARALVYKERKGPSACPVTCVYQPSSASFLTVDDRKGRGGLRECIVGWGRDVFLPQGYPDSVSPDYLHYQFWDSLQAYCSSIAGALSLQATLVGLGVGEGSANPLAATLTWLTKDGSGMLASIAFAYWKGTQMDCNSKQWRLFADFTNDLSHLVRLLGPLLPVPFLGVLCLSAVMTALVGVAGGATRATLAVHQARCDNMADVSAKDGSQETVVNLFALVTNLTLLPHLTSSLAVTWATFLMCVFLHLYTNHQAMRALTMDSLNRPRLLHLLSTWLSSAYVPSTQDANLSEPLLLGPAFIPDYFPHGFRVSVGCSLQWALKGCGGENPGALYTTAAEVFREEKYLLCGNLRQRQLHIVYKCDISPQEELQAMVTAYLCVANYCHLMEGSVLSGQFVAAGLSSAATDYLLIASVMKVSQQLFPDLLNKLKEQGWKVDRLHLGADEWRMMTETE